MGGCALKTPRLCFWPAAARLALLALLATAAVAAEPTPPPSSTPTSTSLSPSPAPSRDLRLLLATVDANTALQVMLADGTTLEGFPHRVEADTLLLTTALRDGSEFTVTAATRFLRAPLGEITEIRQDRRSMQAGASIGARTGAVTVGALGGLIGLLIASFDESGDSNAAVGVVIGVGAGAAIGAALGSGIGAGVGALDRGWDTIWPRSVERPRRRTRLALEPGYAQATDMVVDGHGLSGRLALLQRTSGRIEMGPVVELHNVRGVDLRETPWGTYEHATSLAFGAGLDVRVNALAPGWRPFASGGVGWRVQDDLFLAGHVGGGLRWRDDGARAVTFAARYHFPFTNPDDDPPPFWTFSAGLVFGP